MSCLPPRLWGRVSRLHIENIGGEFFKDGVYHVEKFNGYCCLTLSYMGANSVK